MINDKDNSGPFGIIGIIEKYGSNKIIDETLIQPSTIVQLIMALEFYNDAFIISKLMSGHGERTPGFNEAENECNRIRRIFRQEQYNIEGNYNNITIEMRRNMAASYVDRIIDILEKSKAEKLVHNIMLIQEPNKIDNYKQLLVRYGKYIPQTYQVVTSNNEIKEFCVLEKMHDMEKEDKGSAIKR